MKRFFRRLPSALHYLENPRLVSTIRAGVIADTYQKLNKPWFRELNINTVLDIGANIGRFAVTINRLLPSASIYAFEPLPDCFAELSRRTQSIKTCRAFNVGLGDQVGELTIERSSHSPSSSFLRMTTAHKIAFPFSRHTKPVNVRVERLDDVAEQVIISNELMIKLDVQGYEDRVIRGGEKTIRRAKLVLAEVSFVELYEGQPLFKELFTLLDGWGLRYAGTLSQMMHPESGQILDADCLFIREDR